MVVVLTVIAVIVIGVLVVGAFALLLMGIIALVNAISTKLGIHPYPPLPLDSKFDVQMANLDYYFKKNINKSQDKDKYKHANFRYLTVSLYTELTKKEIIANDPSDRTTESLDKMLDELETLESPAKPTASDIRVINRNIRQLDSILNIWRQDRETIKI